MIALSTLCAIVPMVAMLAFVWWLDRYDREPVWLLAVTFMWGATGAILLGMIGSVVLLIPLSMFDPSATAIGAPVMVAPLIEEPAKALILLAVVLSRHFDNMTDGFVYGAAAGLGFGMTENFLYFTSVAAEGEVGVWVTTVVIRTAFSAVMHAMATSVVGACMGFARFRGPAAMIAAASAGLVVAMGIHALWNGLITLDSFGNAQGLLFLADLILLPMELAVIFVIFQACLWDEKRTIHTELSAEAEQGLIPEGHPAILSSFRKRIRRNWLSAGVDHHAYVRAATQLAMRKCQARRATGPGGSYYKQQVDRLRDDVRRLLRPSQ